uniref:Short myomegalin-like EB1 binding protein N-terminal domain-containing protein n=1 Tax=Anas platyrhynchos TaxID=8839 RepID=A0A8B9TIK0_ANAPL
MKETCRICARELCGNQRRWIFHTAAKLNLQVRHGHCPHRSPLHRAPAEAAAGEGPPQVLHRQHVPQEQRRLRRRMTEPGMGLWTSLTCPTCGMPPSCRRTLLILGTSTGRSKTSTAWSPTAATLRRERATARGAAVAARRCAWPMPTTKPSAKCRERWPEASPAGCPAAGRPAWATRSPPCATRRSLLAPEGRWMGRAWRRARPRPPWSPWTQQWRPARCSRRTEDVDKGVKGNGRCEDLAEDRVTPSSSLSGNRLELALSLIKGLDYKPVQSPRGSRLPVPIRSSLPPPKLSRDLADGSAAGGLAYAGSGFLTAERKSLSRASLGLPLELSELQELWDDLCEDYMPLRVQNLQDERQQPSPGDPAAEEHASDLCATELQGKIQQLEATNQLFQEKLNELNVELKSAQETSQRQDRTIQSLNEALKSKESETEELYHVIEGQNETMAKLRDMLHRSQLGQLQMSETPPSSQEQQAALLDLQNTLFCTQLEVQKLKRAQRQKEHQLAEARRAAQLLETTVHEEEQQKEATWKHNQELRAVVQQLQAELQDKAQQIQAVQWEKRRELQAQEQRIQCLSQHLARKEQLLQESRELLQCQQSLGRSPAAMDTMLEKLQQRVSDRDAALERAVDEKFSALEKKEQELQQLRLSIRERGGDLERLRSVLSSNEATIHSLESLLKAKTLELEQVSATCQNLRWLKEEMEAKSCSRQKEQEGIIQQLQTCLHDRNKEVEELTATLLCKLGPGQSEVAEELCVRLQRKEKMLQDLLSDRNRQAMEHDAEIRELLQAMSTKEQWSRTATEKMAHALAERSCELQLLRQHLLGKEPLRTQSAGSSLLKQDKQPLQEMLQRACGATAPAGPPQGDSCLTEGASPAELEKDLVNAKEELELMAKKERESRRELAALQSVVATQEEELQVQASDMESLTRTIQIKEDLIKDLQMQLVDPEEIPAVERLTARSAGAAGESGCSRVARTRGYWKQKAAVVTDAGRAGG